MKIIWRIVFLIAFSASAIFFGISSHQFIEKPSIIGTVFLFVSLGLCIFSGFLFFSKQ